MTNLQCPHCTCAVVVTQVVTQTTQAYVYTNGSTGPRTFVETDSSVPVYRCLGSKPHYLTHLALHRLGARVPSN